jgi:hypothetical protein
MAEGDRDVPETIGKLMYEIRDRLNRLESARETRVDAMVCPDSKLPNNVWACRTGLAWRMTELSRSAFENLEMDRLVSAILLTRAAVETCAALWYLSAEVDRAVELEAVGDIDEHLGRLLQGSRRYTNLPDPIRVGKFVERVDKDVEGFHEQYAKLCEYAHPNWSGTAHLYSKPDPANQWTDFGANIRGAESARRLGVVNLSVALGFFERSYNRIADAFPAFIELCRSAAEGRRQARSEGEMKK